MIFLNGVQDSKYYELRLIPADEDWNDFNMPKPAGIILTLNGF